MGIFRKKEPTPSPESIAARKDAEVSARRAEADLARAERKADESIPLAEALQAHNDANHYDAWIESLLGMER